MSNLGRETPNERENVHFRSYYTFFVNVGIDRQEHDIAALPFVVTLQTLICLFKNVPDFILVTVRTSADSKK